MRPAISHRIIKPETCVMAFGIPTSEADFLQDIGRPDKDFAKKFKKFGGGWRRYYEEIIYAYEEVVPSLAGLGVAIRHGVTLQEFGELFNDARFDVVILFSHWDSERVEFSSGMADVTSIVARVPVSFDGIIDLCVCHPNGLRDALSETRENCLVRSTNAKATPYLWLYFYQTLFRHLKNSDRNYLEALEQVIASFLTSKR